MQPNEIWNKAAEAAAIAAKAADAKLPPEQNRSFDCGFAWVIVKPARGTFVSWCKQQGHGRTVSYDGGGFQIWYSRFDHTPTQSIGVHEAAAVAFAKVLKENGIPATSRSRLD